MSSSGIVLLMVGWVPKANHGVPTPQSVTVAPAGQATLAGEVPDLQHVHRMAVLVSLDQGERGELQLDIDGAVHTVQGVSTSTAWEMVVV